MSDPTTLRALAGLPLEPASLAESALVLIDCQNTHTEGVLERDGVQAAIGEARIRSPGPIWTPGSGRWARKTS